MSTRGRLYSSRRDLEALRLSPRIVVVRGLTQAQIAPARRPAGPLEPRADGLPGEELDGFVLPRREHLSIFADACYVTCSTLPEGKPAPLASLACHYTFLENTSRVFWSPSPPLAGLAAPPGTLKEKAPRGEGRSALARAARRKACVFRQGLD